MSVSQDFAYEAQQPGDNRMNNATVLDTEISQCICYHCHQSCDQPLWLADKAFCCMGCKTVFEILQANDMCAYYSMAGTLHPAAQAAYEEAFEYLDDPSIRRQMLLFDSETFARVQFHIPAIHCISCIWLLENLHRIRPGILRSEVNFHRKSVTIDYNPSTLGLGVVANTLGSLGYRPHIAGETNDTKDFSTDRSLIYKLAVAGFCFGNVMLFSFPEYLGLASDGLHLSRLFSWLNLSLSLPVLFYSASGFFASAAKTFKQKQINIDVPIVAGLLALFLRSAYDIISASGPGYLDSFAGLVFFLLIGRWFQQKSYQSLSFDRDFRSYFPLAIQKAIGKEWKSVMISTLQKGDLIRVRNGEIIPADASLQESQAYVDYSFVTGESRPVLVKASERIYAGGRLVGQPATFRVEKETSQSQITAMWNNEVFKKDREHSHQQLIDRAARIFTWVVLGIAVMTAVYWQISNPAQTWLVVTSVLMVACPCALALAAPFTYGTMLRVFGQNQFYLKNSAVIERLAHIDAVVFDKTGTVTFGSVPIVSFTGILTETEWLAVKILTGSSTHPLSAIITKSISGQCALPLASFDEIPGKGILGIVGSMAIRLGSTEYLGSAPTTHQGESQVGVSIDGVQRGYFHIQVSVRPHIKPMLSRLGGRVMALLSGDGPADKNRMSSLFRPSVTLCFNQSPADKLNFISNLQQQGRKVLMIGDGLNDAGALKQSDVGIAITDDTGLFTPACDGILLGNKLSALDVFVELAKDATGILKIAFAISFLYNAVALTFAVTGKLTPLTAAVLMPLSSVSVVGFASVAVKYMAHKRMSRWLSLSF